jgi:hypothetical protein
VCGGGFGGYACGGEGDGGYVGSVGSAGVGPAVVLLVVVVFKWTYFQNVCSYP